MSEPAISVIVSTRNRAHYLGETLRTLAAQECAAPYEVIVVDNGSTDETPALIDSWCRRDSRFRTTRESRPGLSRGKNAGIRMARAPLLAFTDDDMRVDPHWIESYRRLFSGREGMMLVAGGPVVPIPHDLGDWPVWLDEAALADVGSLNHRGKRSLARFEYVWGGNMAVPRFVFDTLGMWDEKAGLQGDSRVTQQDSRFFEDTELQDRVQDVAGATWFCPEAVVHHRVDRQSVTPRQVCSRAFTRGRNDFWAHGIRRWREPELIPRRNAVGAAMALSHSLIRWIFWLLLFRVFERKRFFEYARRAAFKAGRSLDAFRAGRSTTRLFHRAARIAFPTRSLLLRFTPDVA